MPWVIWDILVPLLVTFLIGLGTGWLLWRWRRQRGDIAQSQPEQSVIAVQQTDDSANTILIRERDDALERAAMAEAELQSVKSEYEFSIPGSETAGVESALVTNAADVEPTDNSAEIDSLNRELEQERNSRVELERSLLDLNSRYKQLSTRLEEAVNNEEAQAIKQSAAIESEVERSRERIAEQQEALQVQAESEQQAREKHSQELAEKEAQLKQLQSEKDNLQSQLTQANAEKQTRIENEAAQALKPDVVQHTSKVHQLSAYSPEESSLAPAGQATNRTSDKPADIGVTGSANSNMPVSVSGPSGSPVSVRKAPITTVSATAKSNTASELEPDDDQAVETQQLVSQPEAVLDSKAQDSDATSSKVTSISAGNRKVETTKTKPAESESKKSTSSGYVPTGWSVPDKAPSKAERDNLQEIKGVGPVLEKMLHKTGIWYFRQVANLDKQGVIELDGRLPQFSGRIQRDKWVKQAKALHKSKYGSTSI